MSGSPSAPAAGSGADSESLLEREARARLAAEARADVAINARRRIEEASLSVIRAKAAAEARIRIEGEARERAEEQAREEARLRHLAERAAAREAAARVNAESQISVLVHARKEAELRAGADARALEETVVELEELRKQLLPAGRAGDRAKVEAQLEIRLRAESARIEAQLEKRLRAEYEQRLDEMLSEREQHLREEHPVGRATAAGSTRGQGPHPLGEPVEGGSAALPAPVDEAAEDEVESADAATVQMAVPQQDPVQRREPSPDPAEQRPGRSFADLIEGAQAGAAAGEREGQTARRRSDAENAKPEAPSKPAGEKGRKADPQLEQPGGARQARKRAKAILAEARREESKQARERKAAWRKTRARSRGVLMWGVAVVITLALLGGLLYFFQPWNSTGGDLESRMALAGRAMSADEFSFSLTDMARLEEALGEQRPAGGSKTAVSKWLTRVDGQGADSKVVVPFSSQAQIAALGNMPFEASAVITLDSVTALEGEFPKQRLDSVFGDEHAGSWALQLDWTMLTLRQCPSTTGVCFWFGSQEVPEQLRGSGTLLAEDASALQTAAALDSRDAYLISIHRAPSLEEALGRSSGSEMQEIKTAGSSLSVRKGVPYIVLAFDHGTGKLAQANSAAIEKAVRAIQEELGQEGAIEVVVRGTMVTARIPVRADGEGLRGPIAKYLALTA